VPDVGKSSATRPSKNSPSSARVVRKDHRIAHHIEAVGIERLRGLLRRFPVPRRDVRATHRASSLSPVGTSLISVPGTGTPILPERCAWK
jgi:hypothetical protein